MGTSGGGVLTEAHPRLTRPCAFLVPLVDGVKRNIEQCRNLISREGTLRLSAGYVGDDWVHMRDQCRWFGGMVGNHVADSCGEVRRHR
jgi:hypothetical protein